MTQDELYKHILTIVADYRTEFSEKDKRRAIQVFLMFDDYLIDNLPGYCSDECEIDFGAYASYQLDILEGRMTETDKVTRVEIIDQSGRSYVNWNENNKVELSFQDDGRTLKVFISNREVL